MTANRSAKRSIRAKAKRTGMSYQAARNSAQPQIDPCCREFMSRYEKDKNTHHLGPFLFPSSHKNHTPEIDTTNFLVASHLGRIAEKAIRRVEAEDIFVEGYRITPWFFEAFAQTAGRPGDPEHTPADEADVNFQPMTARVPMPSGLYDHLVEVSKRPRIPIPEPEPYKAPPEIRAKLDRFEALAFTPETRGKHAWVNIQTYYVLASSDHLKQTTVAATLRAGKYGVYTNPKDPTDTRDIHVGKFVPDGCVIFDSRTWAEIGPKMADIPEKQEPRRFQAPDWIGIGAVVEVLPVEPLHPDAIPPGQYHILAATAGYTARSVDVVLCPMGVKVEASALRTTTAEFLLGDTHGMPNARAVNRYHWAEVTKYVQPIRL